MLLKVYPVSLVTIRLAKPGLLNGVKTRFYAWDNGNPPKGLNGLHPLAEVISPRIDFTWFEKLHEKITSEKFIAEFKGFIKIDVPGVYRFYVVSDNGVIFSVGDKTLIDTWSSQESRIHSSPEIRLNKGFKRIILLYYNRARHSEVRLGWVKPGGRVEVIPDDRYYFSIGEHVFITGLPDGYVVRMLPLKDTSSEKTCVSLMNICMVEVPWKEQPLEAYVSIYNREGKVFARFSEPLVFFGGDEYIVEYLGGNQH